MGFFVPHELKPTPGQGKITLQKSKTYKYVGRKWWTKCEGVFSCKEIQYTFDIKRKPQYFALIF